MCGVKGKTQEGFDGEPENGVASDEPSMVLNIIVGHSVNNWRSASARNGLRTGNAGGAGHWDTGTLGHRRALRHLFPPP